MATTEHTHLATAGTSITSDPTSYYDHNDYSGSTVYDYEDEVCKNDSISQVGAVFSVVLFSVVVILSLFGNVVVMVILAKYENLKSLTNAFILNLAVSDLIFTAGLPFWAYYYYMHEWTLGEYACKIVNFVFHVGFYSSGILLIVMTIHRYVAVVNPLSDLMSVKGSYSILASVLIWVVSVLAATPACIFTKVHQEKHCEYRNSYWNLWGIYQQNILFVLTAVVFSFCYTQIIITLLRPTAQRRKYKTLKVIFTLMLVFFMSWMPYNVVIFLRSLSSLHPTVADSATLQSSCENYTKPLDAALYISRIFAFSQCCLNPVFYVFVGVKFKNHLKRMMKSLGHNSNSNSNRNSIRSRSSRITSVTSGDEELL
ncbi:chemokine XC receptor 1-like [Genypterus blacodes]|uniref:chemokine XC receptor 1-like n=1 Tax=Genypterus blacodes TaxID=154954 RepID=UPI003F760778